MEWCTDFCLHCDQQTNGSAYCTQTCRLADLDRVACSFEPSSPISNSSHISSSSTNSSPTASTFYLAPAFDFSAYRSSKPTSGVKESNNPLFLPAPNETAQRIPLPRSTTSPLMVTASNASHLKTSTSGTSLASMTSTGNNTRGSLSQQSRNDLFAYASSFDQVRDLRRRKSLY